MSRITPQVRATVLARDGWACVRCGCSVVHAAYSCHHRRPRGAGGTKRPESNLPANLVTLCGSGTTGCHGWVERHREQAFNAGLLLWQTQVPSDVVVETWRGPMLLADDGTFELADRLIPDGHIESPL